MAASSDRSPTLADQLYQLVGGRPTAAEPVRRSPGDIAAAQSDINAFSLVLIPIAINDDIHVAGAQSSVGVAGEVQPARVGAEVVRRPGVQLMGPADSEPLLVSLAACLEAVSDFSATAPDRWWDTSSEQLERSR